MIDIGHWIFHTDFDPVEWYGFVYRITDLDTGKQYIGKKQFFDTRRKKVKGRKNRKIVKKESNWRTYTSSSTHLNKLLEEKGKDHFEFKIETLHETKASMGYAEINRQITENVLREKMPDGTRKYLNGLIGAVKYIPPDETEKERQING